MPNLVLPQPSTPQDVINALVATIAGQALSGPTVTVVPTNGAGTTYTYVVVAKQLGVVIPSLSATITTGAAALSLTAFNTVTWSAVQTTLPPPQTGSPTSVLYDVYRTAGGSTQGKIASNLSAFQLGPLNASTSGGPAGITFNSGAAIPLSVVDTGLVADGSVAPPFNLSGVIGGGQVDAVQPFSAAGAINIATGRAFLLAGSAMAMTLAAPIAGAFNAGGHDGAELTVISNTAFAHTVTTPANAIFGNKHIATFGAAAGNFQQLWAYNGLWYPGPQVGSTLS